MGRVAGIHCLGPSAPPGHAADTAAHLLAAGGPRSRAQRLTWTSKVRQITAFVAQESKRDYFVCFVRWRSGHTLQKKLTCKLQVSYYFSGVYFLMEQGIHTNLTNFALRQSVLAASSSLHGSR